MKSINKHIQYVLDIGAYRGDFTETVSSVWPTCIVYQIEADDRQRSFLKNNAIIALLGNETKDNVKFYTLGNDKITTGSSVFLENTPYYTNGSTLVLQKSMTTLDILFEKHKFAGDWEKYGLIKLDTQGSELMILAGSSKFLESKNPRYILNECSLVEYNINAPKISDVIYYMKNIGYIMVDILDMSYDGSGSLIQTDILFEREK